MSVFGRMFAAGAAAALTLVLAAPAQAYTLDELDCVEREAPEGIADPVMQTLFHDAGLIDEAPEDHMIPFFIVTDTCASQLDIPEELLPQFGTYTLTTLVGQEARDRMVDLGVDMEHVDAQLGIDWRNPKGPQFVISDQTKDTATTVMIAELAKLDLGREREVHALLYIGFYMAMVQGWTGAIGPLTA